MPPKTIYKPLNCYIVDRDGNYIKMPDITSVDLTEDPDMDNAERLFRSMSSASITFNICVRSGSNHLRMNGKRAFRMRCYRRWKRYEIYRRIIGQIFTGNSD